MFDEAYQCVATLQLGSNCCSFIAIFAARSSATQQCERAFNCNGLLITSVAFLAKRKNAQ